MRTKEEIELIYKGWKDNIPKATLSKRISIPWSTIRDYYKAFSVGQYSSMIKKVDYTNVINKQNESYYAYIFGLYLGDGCLTKTKTQKNGDCVYKFRLFQDEKYKKLISDHIFALQKLFPNNKVNSIQKTGCKEIYFCSKNLLELFPQHGPGKKHNRKIELVPWQKKIIEIYPKEFIKGLIQSDGCRFISTRKYKEKIYSYVFYDFSNLSIDIHNLFSWACSLIGVKTRRHGNIIIHQSPCGRKNVKLFETFIGPKS